MKHLKALLLALTLVVSIPLAAETLQKSGKSTTQSFVRTISRDLNIEDKIYVKNKSSYDLSQVVVYLINSKGKYIRLGTVNRLEERERKAIKSYSNDHLKHLRGMRLAIKVTTSVQRPRFDVKLDDHRHDLYIEIDDK